MAKKQDPNQAILDDILSQPVPERGRLSHPLAAKKRGKSRSQISLSDLTSDADKMPEVSAWTTRTFIDYFAIRYNEATGGNFKRVYRSESIPVSQMMQFFRSNGVEANSWTKQFLDWALGRFEEIKAQQGHFTPQVLVSYLNQFYQQEIMPMVEIGNIVRDEFDISLIEEIKDALREGQATEIFARFGIPVATTYLVNEASFEEDSLCEAIEERLAALKASGPIGDAVMERMFRASIVGSPYPREFLCLQWRDKFNKYTKNFKGMAWWREEDYRGAPLPKYNTFLKTGIA